MCLYDSENNTTYNCGNSLSNSAVLGRGAQRGYSSATHSSQGAAGGYYLWTNLAVVGEREALDRPMDDLSPLYDAMNQRREGARAWERADCLLRTAL